MVNSRVNSNNILSLKNLINGYYEPKIVFIYYSISGFHISWTAAKNYVILGAITAEGINSKGYISVLHKLLQQKGIQDQAELIGAGASGDKVTDLYLKLEDDVIGKNPSIVVIWIGVNDVWHKKEGFGTLAKDNNCILVDLRKAFLDYNLTHNAKNKPKGILTSDGVHLNEVGNGFVAEQMFNALFGK